ncbi:TIGR03915 family putative DNA repair protein [Cesiribacter andamanensis]|uniref:Putative DNA metabolism protein n=1 Tax=Cesiribacter andamanensis AMV16 TaxID=1279009 RepID=M7N1V7_9BACT|nr:TIGR03915 family putative DNA repair protein [Cesiribacter andamanensis]EMR01206.1 putative DNA metabolism protein [Cesiribacter andamanensis AMV16]
MKALQYDGSYEGLLCCLFYAYRHKFWPQVLLTGAPGPGLLLQEVRQVPTIEAEYQRVQQGLKKRLQYLTPEQLYWAFLSEQPEADRLLFDFMRYLFDSPPGTPSGADGNVANPLVLQVKRLQRRVFREMHRMHAFVRFEEMPDGLWVALMEPQCNVLPVLGPHFAARYASQRWLLVDNKRGYGLYYDGEDAATVRFTEDFLKKARLQQRQHSAAQQLWQTYFKAVNISARRNTGLQKRHVPARYRALMPEFLPHADALPGRHSDT